MAAERKEATELTEELELLRLPRAINAELTGDPRRSLRRAAGATRYRTLGVRLRK